MIRNWHQQIFETNFGFRTQFDMFLSKTCDWWFARIFLSRTSKWSTDYDVKIEGQLFLSDSFSLIYWSPTIFSLLPLGKKKKNLFYIKIHLLRIILFTRPFVLNGPCHKKKTRVNTWDGNETKYIQWG